MVTAPGRRGAPRPGSRSGEVLARAGVDLDTFAGIDEQRHLKDEPVEASPPSRRPSCTTSPWPERPAPRCGSTAAVCSTSTRTSWPRSSMVGWIMDPKDLVVVGATSQVEMKHTKPTSGALEEIAEAGGWANAIFQFLFRREKFLRLFVERRELQEQIKILRT